MAALFTSRTTNGAGTGAAMSGPCTVYVTGEVGAADVTIEIAHEDVTASYVKPDLGAMPSSRFKSKGSCSLNAYGAYYVRAVVANASATTSVTVTALQ